MVIVPRHTTRFILMKTPDGHFQISLKIPTDTLQDVMQTKPQQDAVYHLPKINRAAREVALAAVQPTLVCPAHTIETVVNGKFTMDSKAMSASRPYMHKDLSHQQNATSNSNTYTDIGVAGSEPPYANEAVYISNTKPLRGGPPLSLDPSNSALCKSLDQPIMPLTTEAEQAMRIASGYYEHDIANLLNAATTGVNTLLPTDASGSELHFKSAHRDTYSQTYQVSAPPLHPGPFNPLSDIPTSQVGLTAWPPNHLPIHGGFSDNWLYSTPNGYNQTPESSMDFPLAASDGLDQFGELVGETPRW